MKIKLIILYLFLFTLGAFAQEAPPVLSNFRVEDDQKSRVYFDSSEPIWGSSKVGFKIEGKTISSLSVNSGSTTGHYFNVSSSFTFWDNHLIRYEGGSDIVDSSSRALNAFTIRDILNYIDEPLATTDRYVTAGGAGKHDGTLGNEWTLSEGLSQAKGGMTVHIKKGTYPSLNYSLSNSGKVDSPIKFIGYNSTPNDSPSLSRSVGMSFDGNRMPLIDGGSSNGWGLNIGSNSYVIFKNIQIQSYHKKGSINSNRATHAVFDNIYLKDGDRGFEANNSNSERIKVLNSYIADVFGVGLRIQNKHNLVDNVWVVSSKVINMDYYIAMYSGVDGHSNTVRNCKVDRYASDSHSGHGLDMRTTENGNKLRYSLYLNCTINNIDQGVSFRHSEVQYNVARNITSTGNGKSGNLVTFRDDCSYNIVENSSARNTRTGIQFRMNQNEDKGQQPGGHHNKVINSTFDGAVTTISDYGIGGKVLPSTSNEFINCTFNGRGKKMYSGETSSFDTTNKFTNCSFTNFSSAIQGNFNPTIAYSNLYNTGSWGNSYSNKNNNISFDSKFEDESKGNFRLRSDSPLIDAGKKIEGLETDFDNNYRPRGSSHDIGAFEYQDNSTSSIRANAGDDITVCKGEEVTLTASGGSQYTWSNGETTQSIEVSPSDTTSYEVTVSDGNTSDKDQVTVTVDQVEANAGQDQTITEGEEATLTASGGDTYLWNNGETTENITVSPNITTTYSVMVTTNGCQAEDQVEVNVNKRTTVDAVVASAGEDQVICKGEEVTLTASGGSQYTWSNGETTESIKVSPSETTTFEVTVSEGNVSDKDQVTVTVDQVEANAGQDQTITEGEEVTLTASGGDTYLWSNGETTENITVSPDTTTTYSVTVTTNNCQAQDQVEIRVNQHTTDDSTVPIAGEDQVELVEDVSENVSIEEGPKSLEIQVYPNPTTGILKLESINSHPDLDIHLINSTGQILYQDKTNSARTRFSKELDLSNYTKGIYFIRLINSTQNEVKKVVLI